MIKPVSNMFLKVYSTPTPYFKGVEKAGMSADITVEDDMFDDYISQLKSKNLRSERMTEEAKKYARILEDNKEETKRMLGILYKELGNDFKLKDTPHKNLAEWRPTMSAEDAEKFSHGSELDSVYYRASASPELHKKNGYNLDRVDLTYPGIYLAQSPNEAGIYGRDPLKVRVNVRNSVLYDSYAYKQNKIISSESRSEDVKNAFYHTLGVLDNVLSKRLNIDSFTEIKQPFEDDPISTYYTIINPKNIVIIEE